MKIIYNHKNGLFTEKGESLLEVYAIIDKETPKYMFDNGWLPFREKWYQTKSSRLKLSGISNRRKKELAKIKISEKGDLNSIVNKSLKYNKFEAEYLDEYLELPHYKFFFDDCFCGIVNLVDNIPYYTFMIWDESNKKHSYGTLSYYFLIDKYFNEKIDYIYISEYYEQFSYKKNLPGFEYWDGNEWVVENKFLNN